MKIRHPMGPRHPVCVYVHSHLRVFSQRCMMCMCTMCTRKIHICVLVYVYIYIHVCIRTRTLSIHTQTGGRALGGAAVATSVASAVSASLPVSV
jgi:hypothetical protein